MNNFNAKLVEYLDVLNKILAGIFIAVAGLKFIDLISDFNVIGAFLETLSILGLGILTCGYIALMLNINNTLQSIRDRLER